MKKSFTLITVLASILVVSCNKKEEKHIETNSRGVPMTIANMIMGETYDIDTLYKSQDQSVIYIDNPDYTQHIIYTGEEVLANDPRLDVDSLADGLYEISGLLRWARVNFANPQSVTDFKATFKQYPEFTTVVVGDTSSTGQRAVFAYAVSVPGATVKHASEVQRWVETCIDDSMKYNPNVKAFGRELESRFFGQWDNKESDFIFSNSRSMLVYEMTQDYVTYHDYFYGYMGGAHGIYGDRFITYSLAENRPVTYENLIKPDCEGEIRELIYEALAADEDFMSSHKITSLSQARTYIQRNLMGDPLPIPEPGLISEGVVFCYQPYDIAPYSDGEFILVVPYHKIAPYLK